LCSIFINDKYNALNLKIVLFYRYSRAEYFPDDLEISQYCAKLDEKKSPPGLNDSIRHMKESIQRLRLENFKETLASGDSGKIDTEIDKAWKNPEALLPEKEILSAFCRQG
jgi:hypothetical protein